MTLCDPQPELMEMFSAKVVLTSNMVSESLRIADPLHSKLIVFLANVVFVT
jgi:hypothetical protein